MVSFCGMSGWAQPATAAARSFYSVKDFGAAGDGRVLDTGAISKAIHAAAAAGGGEVLFPPGIYLTGTFELLSNVTLNFEAGAVLEGSANVADYGDSAAYGFGHDYGTDSSGEGDKVGMIVARHASNIAIVGQGAIDGNGDAFFNLNQPHSSPDYDASFTRNPQAFAESMRTVSDGPVQPKLSGRPGTMIILSDCQNVAIRGITLRNAPNWTLHLQHVEQAQVNGIHIANNLRIPNNDGVDCMACRNVHISDADVQTGDDDFAIVGSDNVTIANCTLVSHSSGIRLEDTRDSVFSNLVIHANRGIGIYERGAGITKNIVFTSLVIHTQLLNGHWWGKAEPIFMASAGNSGEAGGIRNILFSDVLASGESGMVIYGSSGSPIRGITFNRVRLSIYAPRPDVANAVGGNFDLRWTATDLVHAVFKHDIPAVYCRYVDGLNVRGLDIEWGKGLPSYFSNAMQCEDFAELNLRDIAARQAFVESPDAAIELDRGRGVSILGSQAKPGTGTFLATHDVTEERLFAENDMYAARTVFSGEKEAFQLSANRMPVRRKKK